MDEPLKRIEGVLNDHVTKYNDDHLQLSLQLKGVETKLEGEIRRGAEHEVAIKLNEADRNKIKGILFIIGIGWIASTTIIGIIIAVVK